MAGPSICILCLADTCVSSVHPVFNPVSPYGYLLSNVYLFMADIENPDLFVCGCRTWIFSTSPALMRSSASHPEGPHGRLAQNNGKSGQKIQNTAAGFILRRNRRSNAT